MFSHNGFRWDWEQTLDEIRLCDDGEYAVNGWGIHGIKPYLRSMLNMTSDERKEYDKLIANCLYDAEAYFFENYNRLYDWLLSHHFDVRNLIGRGLAIDCTGLNIY